MLGFLAAARCLASELERKHAAGQLSPTERRVEPDRPVTPLDLALSGLLAFVVGLVLGQGLRLAVAGAVIGLGAAAAVARLMQGLLTAVAEPDLRVFAAAGAMMLIVAAAAALVPARRASTVDPIVVLRME